MLSIENPPPDPPCPCEISQLKSSDDNPSHNLPPQQLDLLKSGPKFSIRDYVSSTRSKDIKTNWPFSQENLQLCLKHGVKDLLPPFQSLDAVRNPSAKRCAVENISVDKENAGHLSDEPSRKSNHLLSVTFNDAEHISDSVNTNPSQSQEDREFHSNSTDQSHCETNSFPLKEGPCVELKADTLPEFTVEPEKKTASISNKFENIAKPPVKKCKLIVKLSGAADQNLKEDNKANNFPLSETMTSKVCPVCKTFTSSSNTTLNAHIDQCLSGESTVKWTANPKVIKHRIKPRRMRSMVDIYATAQSCTLEDLDRRNGTNWASSSNAPAQEIEVCAAERKQVSPVSFEGTENEGAVYFDANGTKLRILSKFNDLSSLAKVGDNSGPGRLMKGDKGSKLLLTKKKKKKHAQKLNKLQTFAPDSHKLCSTRHHHNYEVSDGKEQNVASEEVHEKEEAFAKQGKAHDLVKLNEPGTMSGWACSRRTGLMKKMKTKNDNQHPAYPKQKVSGVEDKDFSLENRHVKRGYDRGYVLRSPKCSKTPSPSPKNNVNSSPEPYDDYVKELNVRKRARVFSLESYACYDQSTSLAPSEGYGKLFRKNGSSANGSNKDYPDNHANPTSFSSSQRVETKRALKTKADSYTGNSKQSFGHHAFSPKSKRFSLRKNQPSLNQSSLPESKFRLKRKLLAPKKSQVHCASESDEEAIVWQTGVTERNESLGNLSRDKNLMKETCDNVLVNRTRVLKVRTDRGKIKISRKEDAVKSVLEYHEHDDDDRFIENIVVGAVDGKESAVEEVQLCVKDIGIEPAADMPVGKASVRISKSSDVRHHDAAGCADVQSDARQLIEIYNEPFLRTEDSRCPVEPILSSGQEIFCTDGGDKNIIGQNVHMRAELDCDDEPGNYYVEVEPIPIPGPPGSFLPSPGRMASEEFQGNSSVTSSQVQSSEDHPGFADGDFSDSPSATSTISNPDVTKFDSRFLDKLNLVPQSVQDEIRSSVSGATVDAAVDNLTPDLHAAYGDAERLNSVEPQASMMFPEVGPFRFKNDQPCCCSRKEGATLGAVALNNQESPLLLRQTMSSFQQSATDKQMNGNASEKLNNCKLMSEVYSMGDLSGGAPTTNRYPAGHIPNRASASSEVKFPTNSDGESSSPCSNPVLRLMGKDLMVVNKDENMLQQLKPSQSPMMKTQGNPPSYIASGVYSGNVTKEEPLPAHPMVTQGPIFVQTAEDMVAQHFDVMLPNGYNSGNYGVPQRPNHASSLMLSGRCVAEGSSGALETPEYMRSCYFPPEQPRALNRFGRPLTCDMEKAVRTNPVQSQIIGSCDQTTKEIIIIDDAPESTADLATDAMHGVGMIRGTNTGKSVSVASGSNSRQVDPFYGYQPHLSSPCRGSPLAQSATFHQMPSPVGVSSPMKWNCVPEASNVLPKTAFPSSSSPAYHMRSTLYQSHGGFT